MQTIKLYIKDWLAIHPYIQQQATDRYFVDLANRLFKILWVNTNCLLFFHSNGECLGRFKSRNVVFRNNDSSVL